MTALPKAARKWQAFTGLAMGVFMATLDVSVVNLALPVLIRELGSSFALIQWVVLSYSLVLSSLMLGMAGLGDRLGKKRLYLAGLFLFTLGSLLCGLAPGAGWLVAFRVFQGLGAVMVQSVSMALIFTTFPPRERGRALGMSGSVVSGGLAVGPALGGVLISFLGWRSIFLLNVPLGVLGWIMVWKSVPGDSAANGKGSFDIKGTFLFGAALVVYSLAMTWGQRGSFLDLHVVGLLAAAGACLGIFLLAELRHPFPLLDLRLFRDRVVVLRLTMGFLCFITVGGQMVLPFFMMLVMGLDTLHTGLVMMIMPLSMGLAAPLAGWLSDRGSPHGISVVGALLVCLGCFFISRMGTGPGVWDYLWRGAMVGLGMGAFQAPNNTVILSRMPPDRVGLGSGLVSLARVSGVATGVGLLGALFAYFALKKNGAVVAVGDAPAGAIAAGLEAAYLAAAAVAGLAALLALRAWRLGRRSGPAAPPGR